MARKEKILELDILRGLAFLAVVMQHTLGVYIRQPAIQNPEAFMLGMVFNSVKFAVPAFVFVTGIVLFYNYFESIQYVRFIKKRVTEILVPYLAWTCIYEVYANGMPVFNLHWLIGFAKNVILGREYYHLWFVVMIFQFYLLFPVFSLLFRRVYKSIKNLPAFILVMLVITCVYTWFMWFIAFAVGSGQVHPSSRLFDLLLRFIDRTFLSWSYYFVLGGIVGVSLHKWREFVARSVSWNSFAFVIGFVWVGYELFRSTLMGKINLNYSTSLKPSMFFYTVSELVLIYGLSLLIVRLKSPISSTLKWFGDYSYGAYLVHALVLIYAVRVTNYLLPSHAFIWKTFVCAGLCALVAVGFTHILSKLPLASVLVGSSGKKQRNKAVVNNRVVVEK